MGRKHRTGTGVQRFWRHAQGHALDWYAQGADFTDALHFAACGSAIMHTLDRDFCKAAREAGIAPEVPVWEV